MDYLHLVVKLSHLNISLTHSFKREGYMKKNEKIILSCFMKLDVPEDFIVTFGRELFISTLTGYVQELLKNGSVQIESKNDFLTAEDDFKKEVNSFLNSKDENIIYYNMIKSCLLIIKKFIK